MTLCLHIFLHSIYTFGNQKCAKFVTTLLTLMFVHIFLHFIYTFADQKCATIATLWLHHIFPHFLHTFYTLPTLMFVHIYLHFATLTSSTQLLIKNVPHLLHFPYTFPTLLTTPHFVTLHVTNYTFLLHFWYMKKRTKMEKNKPQHLGFPCGPPPWY